jgi:CBS domain-containing protein
MMKIGSVCRRRVVTIDEDSSVVEAAALMREHHVGSLVVTVNTPEGMQVGGVVTDRDLVLEVLARGIDATGATLRELARQRIVSVSEDDDLSSAIAAMHDGGVRRLLVTNDEQQLVGIVAFDDLISAAAGEMEDLVQVIRIGMEREVTESKAPQRAMPALRIPAMGTVGWRQPVA